MRLTSWRHTSLWKLHSETVFLGIEPHKAKCRSFNASVLALCLLTHDHLQWPSWHLASDQSSLYNKPPGTVSAVSLTITILALAHLVSEYSGSPLIALPCLDNTRHKTHHVHGGTHSHTVDYTHHYSCCAQALVNFP